MNKLIYILLAISTSFFGCSSISPYPYSDYSNPVLAVSALSDQNQVEGNVQAPLNSVCHIKTTRKNYKSLWLGNTPYNGSAALIDGRYLITAAHNVYDYPLNYLTSISVSCGTATVSADTVQVTLNRYEIADSVSVPRYAFRIFSSSKQYEYDYAFIDLGKNIDSGLGFIVPEGAILKPGNKVYIAGYPGGNISNGYKLFSGEGVVVDVDGNLASYSINTATGNSGGPVWVEGDNGKYYLAAVHVKNSGGRILNVTLLNDWQNWLNERE